MRLSEYHRHVCDALKIEDTDERRRLRPMIVRYYARGFSMQACVTMVYVQLEAEAKGAPKMVTPSEPPR